MIPLNILITVLELDTYSGLPLYTRDVALELKRQGYHPEIYTLKMGRLSQELLDAGIHVTDNPSKLKHQPDIIHGQHRVSTLIAVKQFRRTPAIFICHNHTFWGDEAPFHPRILRYFGVSNVCMERLAKDGVLENKIHFLSNFVNTSRFLPRPPLPTKPQKALVFSNYASERTHLPVVREACLEAGLQLDVVGAQNNYITKPETILGNYDIIFAKAKAAIEAMAVGAAVVLCDFSGIGPMVTTKEFDELRRMNFGFQALTQPFQPEFLLAQIRRYNPQDAMAVQYMIRSTASLEEAAISLVENYLAVIQEYKHKKTCRTANGGMLLVDESFYWERARFWAAREPRRKDFFDQFSGRDDASKEKDYVFVRDAPPIVPDQSMLINRAVKEWAERFSILIKKATRAIKFFPFALWMIIPESIRTQIKKKLPFVSKVSSWLIRVLHLE